MMGLTTPLCLCTFMIWVNIAALRELCVCESLYGFTIYSSYSIFVCMYVFSQDSYVYAFTSETHTHTLSSTHTRSCSVQACDLRWMDTTGFYLQVCKSAQLYIRRSRL